MRKSAIFISLCAVTLSLLVVLPKSHASGGCERVVVNSQTISYEGCPFVGNGNPNSGYGVMITPGSTWEIFHFEGQPKVVDLTGYQSNGGLFTFTAGVQYYAQITGTGVIGMGQQ